MNKDYLLGQEHITDRELDEIFQLMANSVEQLEQFKVKDKRYRELEEDDSKEAMTERLAILDYSIKIMEELKENGDKMMANFDDARDLFMKAKGALEAKLEE